jgi:soluble lytic murein transglycosylase-like protein
VIRAAILAACILCPGFTGLSRADVALYQTCSNRYSWLNYDVYSIAAEQARHHGLRLDLVLAVIDAESGGNTRAVSRCGARGMMQVLGRYWYRGNVLDLHIPRVNIQRGCVALRWAHDVAGGDLVLTLKRYERGYLPGINKRYVNKILRNMGEI